MQQDDSEERAEMITQVLSSWSPEGAAEIAAALERPPLDTPERRRGFELARKARFLVDQVLDKELKLRIPK